MDDRRPAIQGAPRCMEIRRARCHTPRALPRQGRGGASRPPGMNFVSWAFALLFALVYATRLLAGRRKTEPVLNAVVMTASTVFVMWHVPEYLLIMLTSIGVDYVAAIYIERAPDGSARRRWWLAGSIATNLALLGFFKYTNFALDSVEQVLSWAGVSAAMPVMSLALPMGISFYTFCSMSYTIDVYRRRIRPVERFRDFYYFVTFFPHLVAGPIIRAEQFFYQMPRPRRPRLRVFNEGAFLIVSGLFLKMVCADNLSGVVDEWWTRAEGDKLGGRDLALLMLLFGGQIFCDFAGYSNIARGLAYLMGWRFPINFDSPYIAGSFRNFWERWHITLSQWLRDYLYVPLGGNRMGARRTYVNLMIVMLLGGLWHGAAATFVVWGAIHGAGLAIERLLGLEKLERQGGRWALKLAWFLVVQACVFLAWVMFRSQSLTGALTFVRGLARFGAQETPVRPELATAALFLVPVVLLHVHRLAVERGWIARIAPAGKAALAGAMLWAVFTLYGASSDFIYFQF